MTKKGVIVVLGEGDLRHGHKRDPCETGPAAYLFQPTEETLTSELWLMSENTEFVIGRTVATCWRHIAEALRKIINVIIPF
jgi:hypothetical protein